MKCPTCGLPMTMSTERNELWCAVYGTHPERLRLVGERTIPALMRAAALEDAQQEHATRRAAQLRRVS